MGLDMYLNAERYLWSHDDGDKQLSENIGQLVGLPADGRIKTITVEAGYWRKANQIHRWFVENVQDGEDNCQEAGVSREKLTELRELCQQAIDKPEHAHMILPTREGFFFGGKDYDQWYFDDLKETIEVIDNALAMPEQWDFNYRSSW
jgi:hypothetical protein